MEETYDLHTYLPENAGSLGEVGGLPSDNYYWKD
jgi:hypothetical protein